MSSSQGTSVCSDAGSQFCPCVLADLGECITCSLLRGEALCDCAWSGVCVYSEYLWAGKRPLPPRPEYEMAIKDVFRSGRLTVFTLGVPRNLVNELSEPGAFLFLRPPGTRQCFNAPISVMDVDWESARFAVQVMGPKTKALDRSRDFLLARGPYWNGVLGSQRLRRLRNSHALVVARGIGQGPAVHVASYLLRKNNRVTAALASGDLVDGVFAKPDMRRLGVPVVESPGAGPDQVKTLVGLIREGGFDLVHSSGPDSQHRALLAAIREAGSGAKLTASNNSVMCCGDGVCGGCGISTKSSLWTRACKAAVNPEDVAFSTGGEHSP
ncbi:MAG: hypothetical protein HPY55_13660 [Firmicutes bacterium]|nr:hypothetical protein [Bacillota bacterium]